MSVTKTDIKKRILRGRNAGKYGPAELHVGEMRGELWATNKYWIVRASRVAPLLAEYNLTADEPGVYDVNGRVSRSGRQLADFTKFPGTDPADYAVPATRVQVAGRDAFVNDSAGNLLAVYQLADGTMAGLLADEIGWLTDRDAAIPAGHRVNGVRVMFRYGRSGETLMAAFVADTTHVIEPHKYGTDPETREPLDVPEVSEPGAPVLLAVVVATNFSAGS
jgi:hypothetical protein